MLNDFFEFNNFYVIKNLNYKETFSIDEPPEEIEIKDDLSFDYTGDEIRFTITRKISFKPISIFDVDISIESVLLEVEDSKYNGEKISIEEFIENFDVPISSVCARISAIISSITSASNNAPLITPPQLLLEID